MAKSTAWWATFPKRSNISRPISGTSPTILLSAGTGESVRISRRFKEAAETFLPVLEQRPDDFTNLLRLCPHHSGCGCKMGTGVPAGSAGDRTGCAARQIVSENGREFYLPIYCSGCCAAAVTGSPISPGGYRSGDGGSLLCHLGSG